MKYQYEPVVDSEHIEQPHAELLEVGPSESRAAPPADTNLNNIYAKVVKTRKELEKSYNVFYSYYLILENSAGGEGARDPNRPHASANAEADNTYSSLYNRYEGVGSNSKTTKYNLTLNKINALTNSFYMNVDILKNTYSFIKSNRVEGSIPSKDYVIWDRRIETLSNEADSFIKTLDTIYKNNLNKSETNRQNNAKRSAKRNVEDEICYLHSEKEALKQVETSLNIFQTQGLSTLNMVKKQNKFLKGVRKKVIDISNYLGISSSILDTIKKVHKQNLMIVIVGIVLSLLFFYVLYSYVKG